ncbi:MAG: type I methionyl aminopeptidase [Anaerolineae bacterium]|nr:type I methionyl aminopeptidase [Anaerolineae bacterium]MBN8618465.1 type I methionyl aminopeptidase [Anaerolineae bacterium]
MAVYIKSADEIAIMREAGRVVARAHAAMRDAVRPGISTADLDAIAETVIRDHGAIPAFLNYPKRDAPNFPATITASINSELVHGIPSPKRILQEGDIVSLDVGCHYQGFVGDAAFTYAVGEVSTTVKRLLDVTERSLYVGIEASVLPNSIRDVALAVQRYVESQGYSVAREYTGHGVGRAMHEEPEVPNWWSRLAERRGRRNYPLQVGMTYAIEPMVIAGRAETEELEDGWTVLTKDRSLCAHFEHTIAITDGKPVILTLP